MADHCSQQAYRASHAHDNERRMRTVVLITAVMMIAEIAGGWWFGSMALLADGFHMGTHVVALGISALAYAYARRYAHDARYSFGTGKVGDLAGFTSAILLGVVALSIFYESFGRLLTPKPIVYGEAILLAILGLAVNVASAIILGGPHEHDHEPHGHTHTHDNNFRSAYVHVLADALTSILAIVALGCGWYFGWQWFDPVTGLIGSFVILSWAWSLLRDTAAILLDRAPEGVSQRIRDIIKEQGAEITDIHLWRIGPEAYAAIVALSSSETVTADHVRAWLEPLSLAHVTVEINQNKVM